MDAEPDPSLFDAARAETIRYHEELYATSVLGEPGTWLARPSPFVLNALGMVAATGPVVAYDLGAGIGRHAHAMLDRLTPGSTVIAVDLLASALARLDRSAVAPPGIALRTVVADLAEFEFDEPADLVVAFSALEHLPDLPAIEALLSRIAHALAPGGVVAIGIVADRFELTPAGSRPALLESAISAEDAEHALMRAFVGFEILTHDRAPADVAETRDGETHRLCSTLVTFSARRSRRSP